MHPAKSVIFFTTTSGAGYGLLVWLAVYAALGLLPAEPGFGVAAFGLAFGLVTAGLLSSTFHLGHPERAWRAMSQWRSSWLSREGLLALLTYVPTGLFALLWVFGRDNGGWAAAVGLVGAAFCLATVYATAMIYASLKTIGAWANDWTKAKYLVVSLMMGAVGAAALAHLFGYEHADAFDWIALVVLAVGAYVQRSYWRHVADTASASTPTTATGLEGKVRLLEAPHTEENYLLTEMGYKIARKHARRLRRIAMVLGFALPLVLVAMALAGNGWFATMLVVVAALVCGVGVVIQRWLFFAEARHVVTLYYGAATA